MLALLMLMTQGAWGWNGSGTSSDPYLVTSAADWNDLSAASAADTYSGKYFCQTADITGVTTMVGTETTPFDGFYVRPSFNEEYLGDVNYTQNLQRTNLISKG